MAMAAKAKDGRPFRATEYAASTACLVAERLRGCLVGEGRLNKELNPLVERLAHPS
jgi:hypothetical protein